MSNHTFNEYVVPLLQPDPSKPGETVDRSERSTGAMLPRRTSPETGLDVPHHVAPDEYPEEAPFS